MSSSKSTETESKQVSEQKKILGRLYRILKRTYSELNMYRAEELEEKENLNKMINDNVDKSRIKQQKNVIAETIAVMPRVRGSVENAYNKLHEFTDAQSQIPSDDKSIKDASKLLSDVKAGMFKDE